MVDRRSILKHQLGDTGVGPPGMHSSPIPPKAIAINGDEAHDLPTDKVASHLRNPFASFCRRGTAAVANLQPLPGANCQKQLADVWAPMPVRPQIFFSRA